MVVISVHVPKCAGTSFRSILSDICGARIWFNYGVVFSRDQARPGVVPAGVSFIHGHFLADAFDDLFPDRLLLTWVRHPVERVLSQYNHFLRSPDMRDNCCRELYDKGLSLHEFADLEWMRNTACRYLANKPVEDFEFVGIAERFQESMEVFCERFGFRSVARFPRENVNPARGPQGYRIPRQTFDYIAERNGADMAWYDNASRRMDAAARRAVTIA